MTRIRPSILFIYSLVLSMEAFLFREPSSIWMIAIPNLLAGIILGFRRYKLIIGLFLIGYIGLFINSLIVSNIGEEVIRIWFITVRSGAVESANSIFMRLGLITGATLLFLSLSNPLDTVKALENDLRLPKGPTFSIYYGLRLFPLVERIYRDVRFMRMQRGYRGYIVTPNDLKTFLLPILSNLLDKAYWTGIAVELRGFSLRKRVGEQIRLEIWDYLILSILIIEFIIPFAISTGLLQLSII